MTRVIRHAVAVAAGLVIAVPAVAGVYLGQQPQPIHPGFAYQGVGGRVDVALCPTSEMLVAARNVAAKLNRRANGLGNIARPGDVEFPPADAFSVEDVLMHELGHAVGLDHPMQEVVQTGGTAPAVGIAPALLGPNGALDAQRGPDGVFGTEDDLRGDDVSQTPFPLTNNNSPFVVPNIVDNLSMSTDRSLRAVPGTWPIVPWVGAARSLGLPDTQSVMMTFVNETVKTPSPDELTLLKWTESGADGIAATEDDYRFFFYVLPIEQWREAMPPNCITVARGPLPNGALGQAQFNRPFGETAIYSCFGSALCLRSSRLVLSDAYTWHFPATDTSNGDADFIPLAPSDVAFTLPSQIEVNQGIPQRFDARVVRTSGEAFPPGSSVTVNATNGAGLCVQKKPVTPNLRSCGTQFDLAGAAAAEFIVSIDGDSTPSSGALFFNVFVPNRDVARGRVTVVDRAEALVMSFVPSVIQVPTSGVPDQPPELQRAVEFVIQTSQTKTPLVGATVRGLVRRQNCTFSADNTISVTGPVFLDEQTDSEGKARTEALYLRNIGAADYRHESQCEYTYLLADGFTSLTTNVRFTTGQVVATLSPDRNVVVLRDVSDGQQETVVFQTRDQLGAPMAAGVALDAVCASPDGNQVLFAPVGPVTTDASGAATLTVVASTQAGTGFTEPVVCTLSRDGVRGTVSLSPLLPATLALVPASAYLMAPQIVAGQEFTLSVVVRDALGDVMPGIPVSLSCPSAVDLDATVVQPVLPTTRTTDNAGQVMLAAAIARVGRRGLNSPVDCTVSAGRLSAAFRIEGQDFRLFRHGFEAAAPAVR